MSNADSFQEMAISARRIIEETKSVFADFDRTRLAFWEGRAGPLLAEMLGGRRAAERFLKHPDAHIRTVALEVLEQHWMPDDNLWHACERMAFEDPDSQVRNMAIIVLGSCFEYTDDPRVGRLLAVATHDEQYPTAFRSAAYRGLYRLRGTSLTWPGLYSYPPADFPFPEGVDWSFVDSFLDESRVPLRVDPIRASAPSLLEADVDAIRLYKEGVDALERRDYGKCVESVTAVLALMPYAAGGYYLRGCAYIELGRADEAIADLTRAVEANPNSVRSLRECALAYRLKGDIDSAELDERAAAGLADADCGEAEDTRKTGQV